MLAALLVVALAATAFAQSSGNFTASFDQAQCSIADDTGQLSGGISGNSLPEVSIKVSGGNGVALVITPSLVTGLYTSHSVTSSSPVSKQNIGLRVKVEVDGSTATVIPELGSDGVIYDQRFMKVRFGFLAQLTTPCTSDCFDLIESTLSAHSFNFYISNLTPGTHTVKVSWDLIGGKEGEVACVGPGTLTVVQVKNFSFNTQVDLP
jgi:hypothetical protein